MRLQGTCPPPFRESIRWMISPFKFWTATIFLHAHLQLVYYKCVKFHKNPISRLGVALTRYMDGRTDGRTDRVIPIYPPPPQTLHAGGIKTKWLPWMTSYNFCKRVASLSHKYQHISRTSIQKGNFLIFVENSKFIIYSAG